MLFSVQLPKQNVLREMGKMGTQAGAAACAHRHCLILALAVLWCSGANWSLAVRAQGCLAAVPTCRNNTRSVITYPVAMQTLLLPVKPQA